MVKRRRMGNESIQVFSGASGKIVRIRLTDKVLVDHLGQSISELMTRLFGKRCTAAALARFHEAMGECMVVGSAKGATSRMQPLLDAVMSARCRHFERVHMFANVIRFGKDVELALKNACVDVVED